LPSFPPLHLDRSSPTPLTQQLATQIAHAIRAGLLAHDSRLPSTRLLASMIGVSRNTVVVAYELLMADGLVEGRQGSGVRAVGPPQTPRLDLATLLREARFPEQFVGFEDGDGTFMYVRFSK
jgi:GntR family transcriptional regulator/MocR family aminotransferase